MNSEESDLDRRIDWLSRFVKMADIALKTVPTEMADEMGISWLDAGIELAWSIQKKGIIRGEQMINLEKVKEEIRYMDEFQQSTRKREEKEKDPERKLELNEVIEDMEYQLKILHDERDGIVLEAELSGKTISSLL